jgi:hypothetical protein
LGKDDFMWWKPNGYFLFDILLSIATLMLLSSILLPQAIEFKIKSNNQDAEFKAKVVLYEKLQELLAEEIQPSHQIIIKNSKQYIFTPSTDLTEVCVQYEDKEQNKKTVCENWE